MTIIHDALYTEMRLGWDLAIGDPHTLQWFSTIYSIKTQFIYLYRLNRYIYRSSLPNELEFE